LSAEKGAKLLAEDILKEAEEKAATIIKEAKEQANAIIDAARINAEEEEKRKLAEATAKGQQIYREILAQAKVEAKKEILKKKELLIKEAFKEAEERLRKHSLAAEYKEDLIRITVNACKKLDATDVVITANQRDLKTLKSSKETIERELERGNRKIKISFGEPIQTAGGVRVKTADGRIEVDETFEGIIQKQFELLRVKVAKILFEGSQ
jgi:V/A-type H+-transporting ATPase subunit E